MDPSVSDSEWKVMEVLWQHPGSTLNEIVKNLSYTGWSYSTIKTLLNRLVEKGFAEVDKSVAYSFKYKAAIEEKEHKTKETKKFLQKVYDGSISMFISTLAKESNLTKDEVEELMRIIGKMEG